MGSSSSLRMSALAQEAPRACAVQRRLAVHEDGADPFGGADRALIGRGVLDLLRIEQDQIGRESLPQKPPVGEPESRSGEAGHLVNRVLKAKQPDVAYIMPEDAGEGTPEPGMGMLIVRQSV